MNQKLIDYHIHTSLCNHANGTMKDFVKSGISAGLSEMGFSDHNPLPDGFDDRYRMRINDMEIYFNTIFQLKRQFPEIEIKAGIELDFIEEAVDFLYDFTKRYDFDYVIGSIHYMRDKNNGRLKYLNEFNADQHIDNYQQYFKLIGEAAKSGIFDVIAHFDLPKKFWGKMDTQIYCFADDAMQIIKQNNLSIEINSSGFRTINVGEPFPGQEILYRAKALHVPVTLGSDSHWPRDIASHFKESVELLKKVGYKHVVKFAKRKKEFIHI